MNRRDVSRIAALLVLLCSIAPAAPAAEKAKEGHAAGKVPWKITGQLEEACSCNAACPCWFGSKPTRMNCGGGQVLFIEKGNYGKVALDGLAVASLAQSPDGKSMMESFGSWNFNNLYIDEKASPEQRQALQEVGSITLALSASPKNEIRYVPITRKIEGKEHKISIGTVASLHGHLIEGGLPGSSPRIVNPPAADPIHREYQQGLASRVSYRDSGQDWNFEDTNYMFGTFTVDSAEYEKFGAMMAQKMKAAQDKPKGGSAGGTSQSK